MPKLLFKRLMFILGVIVSSPLILLTLLEGAILGKRHEKILGWCKEILSLVPTLVGEYLRLGYYWAICDKISLDACLMFGSMIAHRETSIGAYSVIGTHSIIGYSRIGEHVLIAAGVSLISGKYQHGKPQERAGGLETVNSYETISVGRCSWIGQGAIIMANIGENCTIGAGSVVYKDVPSNCTYMGNPARKVNVEPPPSTKES